MNTFRTISRFLVATSVIFVSHMSAVITVAEAQNQLKHHRFTIAGTFVADHIAVKNEHAKKAFIETVGRSLDKHDISKEDFAQHLAFNYGIRKGSEFLNAQGITVNAALKKVDVLPEGMVRDTVNSVAKTTAEVATHPETLTLVAMYVLQNFVIPALSSHQNS